ADGEVRGPVAGHGQLERDVPVRDRDRSGGQVSGLAGLDRPDEAPGIGVSGRAGQVLDGGADGGPLAGLTLAAERLAAPLALAQGGVAAPQGAFPVLATRGERNEAEGADRVLVAPGLDPFGQRRLV